ncbi:UNVERIFIED_CONTAM: hypothetical protein C7454_14114 [Acidovorax defluvii]
MQPAGPFTHCLHPMPLSWNEIKFRALTVKKVDVLNGDNQVAVLGREIWAWNGRKL